jgi:outer membrane protein assembly factor BamB
MKKRRLGQIVEFLVACAFLCVTGAVAQDESGDWSLTGADAGHSGWQKGERSLSPNNIASDFRFLWKIKLGQSSKLPSTFSEPLLAGRLINAQGFKDIVYWGSADTLFAVDSELGDLLWKREFQAKTAAPATGCGASSLDLLMEPPVTINFNARRKRKPGEAPPHRDPPPKPNERRLGISSGGAFAGLKGIYVLTADGMLHEQVMTTGADFAPPVKFLPAGNISPSGLNFFDHTIFTATGRGCGGASNGLWAIDLTSADYPVASYLAQPIPLLDPAGPLITPDGSAIIVTGRGTSSSKRELDAGGVVAVSKDMKAEDWYVPEGGMANYQFISPVTFSYKGMQLVVAPGNDGKIVLLDVASLGGTDHHTPLFETPPVSNPGQKHGWDGFATWQDKDGTTWVFASVSAGISLHDPAIKSSGPAAHGAIVAFKVDQANGKPALIPAWISPDLVNPAPPRVTNGVVIALSGGNASTHATLYVLNAATGEELYSSKSLIPTYTQMSGVAVGDSHAFFTDHDNVLYSFGIGLEH